jgi:hypothetical protein
MKDRGRKWMWGVLAAILAVQIYYVRELLAALLLFASVFVVLAALGLGLYLLQQAGELSFARLAPATRRGWGYLTELSRRPFRRPHSETAR